MDNTKYLNLFHAFEDRIPASALKDSCLWSKIVEEKEAEIRSEIVLG